MTNIVGKRRRRAMKLGRALIVAFGVLFMSPLAPAPASAELLIAPTRVVLEGREISAELTLVNKGNQRSIYRISVENRRMLENGAFERAKTAQPGELFADGFIRFSPRRVVLEPGAKQTVRVVVRPPSTLADGEYRSHLRVLSAPENAGLSANDVTTDSDKLSISLVPIRSITIPIIYRKGALSAKVAIANAKVERIAGGAQQDMFVVNMTRKGDRSTFGNLIVEKPGAKEPALLVRGIAIYVPNGKREVRIPLDSKTRSKLTGKLRVRYVTADAKDSEVISERMITLP